VFVASPREGSGRVWRQEEVPAFPPEPSPTQPTRYCQHILVYKKVTRFCLARHLWTSLYLSLEERIHKLSISLRFIIIKHEFYSEIVLLTKGGASGRYLSSPLSFFRSCRRYPNAGQGRRGGPTPRRLGGPDAPR